MGGAQTQIATEQLNLVPGHVMIVDHPDVFSEAFMNGLDCLTRQLTRVWNAQEALDALVETRPDVILVPHQLPKMTGLEFLEKLQATNCDSGVVVVVSHDDLEAGARALELGALDFLIEPVSLDQVVATMSLVATIRRLNQANDSLLQRMNQLKSGGAIVGVCPATRRLTTVLARAAESSVTCLIEGPVGAGKSLAAQIIHSSSRHSSKRLEVAYGDTLTAERIDELLRDGRVGTLLLENVETLLPEVQSKVVRHIKERSSASSEQEGVRIIATTAAHLPELVARGKFREDLFYRLNMFPVSVPSLRERREDIATLANHFLDASAERTGEESLGFSDAALHMLENHTWPGNIAQLQDVVFRAQVLARGEIVDGRHLHGVTTGMCIEPAPQAREVTPQSGVSDPNAPVTEEDILPLETEEKRLLARALRATKGNVRRASQLLRIGRATLYRKIQVYQLKLN